MSGESVARECEVEASTTRRSLTRIRRFINKQPGWSTLTQQREDGYLYCDPTQTHTHTHIWSELQQPELWTADRTFHSLQSYVRFPASGWLSLPACVCLSCVCVCEPVCACWTGIWSLADRISLHLILLIFLL